MTYIFSELINRVNLCAAEQFTDERRILAVFVIARSRICDPFLHRFHPFGVFDAEGRAQKLIRTERV